MSPAQPASATLSLPSRRNDHAGATSPAAVDSHELLRGQNTTATPSALVLPTPLPAVGL